MREIFEIKGVNNDVGHNTNVGEGSGDRGTVVTIPRLTNMTLLELPNLKILRIQHCDLLENIFTSSTLESLKQLEELTIWKCNAIQVIVKEDGEHTIASKAVVFPHLKSLTLAGLPNLKGFFLGKNDFQWPLLDKVEIYDCPQMMIFTSGHSMAPKLNYIHMGLGKQSLECSLNFDLSNASHECSQVGVASWSLCQYSKGIYISGCDALLNVIPSHAVGQLPKLEELKISRCRSMREIFEIEGVNNDVGHNTNIGEGSGDTGTVVTIPRLTNMALLELFKLKILQVEQCDLLEHIFTSSTLESLKQLEELTIKKCNAIQVIVKEDGEHTITSKDVVFPHLKSLTLAGLPNLKGFFLGKNDFQWPLLDKVKIYGCPQLMIFTSGHSMASNLDYIHTGLGKHSLECGLNFDLTNASHETQLYSSSTCSTPDIIKLLQFPWSFSNLIEVDVHFLDELTQSNTIFPCNEFLKLQNLEKPEATRATEEAGEVFEVVEGTNDDAIETQSVVIFSKLKEVNMDELYQPRCIWKSNWWTTLNLSNLTKVSIRKCQLLEHVFSCCMVGSLLQLQELHISYCENMEVIVKQVEDSETRANEVVFPYLKSLKLRYLKSLKGFCLGREAFRWPSLDTLKIKDCPKITVFTNGQSTTPKLKVIDTSFGLCDATDDSNSFIRTMMQEGFEF